MNRKYDEAMGHIEVTPEMHDRILNAIENMDFEEKKQGRILHFPNMKHFATLAACLAVVLVGVLTFPDLLTTSHEAPVDGNNDIVEVSSAAELSETVGFEVEEPGVLPFDFQSVVYTAYWTEMAEITYTDDEQAAVFRKGIGSEDISGDYNSYELTEEISVDGIDITLKGNGITYTLAIWTAGEFAYSLSLNEGVGETEWVAMLQAVK